MFGRWPGGILPVLAVAALLGGAAPAAAPVFVEVTTRNDVAYGPLPAERGDLYLPASRGSRLRRAILMIHGGGWVSGQRTWNAQLSTLLASQDFVVFNIDYRLAVAAKPETHWPAQLDDARMAARYLRDNAPALGIDPARIGAMGDSAGATLAVFLGMTGEVAAVVDQFGITDLAALGDGAIGLVEALFGTRVPGPGLLESVSPLSGATGRSAPMFLVHGDRDQIVPRAQSEQLVRVLRDKGVAVQLVTYAGGHGYDGLSGDELMALFARESAWLDKRLPR